jgi:hypothetical protein
VRAIPIDPREAQPGEQVIRLGGNQVQGISELEAIATRVRMHDASIRPAVKVLLMCEPGELQHLVNFGGRVWLTFLTTQVPPFMFQMYTPLLLPLGLNSNDPGWIEAEARTAETARLPSGNTPPPVPHDLYCCQMHDFEMACNDHLDPSSKDYLYGGYHDMTDESHHAGR